MTAQKQVVLVTGVADYWGSRVAAKLVDIPGLHVIGLDSQRPAEPIKDLDFIQADIRNPLLVDLLKQENVETVCHLTFMDTIRPTETAFELNVMGAIRVLGACAEAGVRKAVLRSSTAVYGACPSNPAFITEDQPLHCSRSYGYTRDLAEIEAFCNGFRRQVPGMILTVLRFASIVGPTADTPMSRFLRDMRVPVLLGFDPMMQVIHEDDVVDCLVHSMLNDAPGVFNVAAEGVLPLWRLMALAGKVPLPVLHLLAYWAVDSGAFQYAPIEPDYIRFPWVADITPMRQDLCFAPHYTAEEALREFAGQQRIRQYLPEAASLAYDEERLRDTLERRRRGREPLVAAETDEHEVYDD